MSKINIEDSLEFPSDWNIVKPLFGVGIVGLLISGIGYFLAPAQFFFTYLVCFAFFMTLTLGGLFFVLLQHLTRAQWSVYLRRIPEVLLSNIWIWGLFLIPVLLGMFTLYHWTDAQAVAESPVLQGKSYYLNIPFFLIRQVIYLSLWSFLGYQMYHNSVEMDKTGNWGLQTLMRRISGPGMFLFALSFAFASVDWLMSLDPHWYSTIFGVYIFAMSVQAFYALLMIAAIFFKSSGILSNMLDSVTLYDIGIQMFGFTIFYAYISFAQFLLIYYANLPEETVWFLHRLQGGYQYLAYIFLFGRFAIPFLVLLPKKIKSNMKVMTGIASLILFSHFVELYWIVMPTLNEHGFYFNWPIITSFLGLGGMFLGLFFYKFKQQKMIPVKDPKLAESINRH